MKYPFGMITALVLLAATVGAGGQTVDPPGEADSELSKILEEVSPEELEEIIRQASARRLQVERQQVLSELQGNLLYDPDDVDRAGEILRDDPADTQADNIDRIERALSQVDPRFAEAHELFGEGEFARSADRLMKLRNPEEATYFSAAVHYLCGRALQRSGKPRLAVEVWSDLMVNLPNRISFAAESAIAAAEEYENLGRGLYAMEMYHYALQNYSLTLPRERSRSYLRRLEALQDIYAEPMKTVASRMDEVSRRLDREKVGRITQEKQQKVVALLEDLIKTIEEKSAGGSASSGRKRQQRKSEPSEARRATGQSVVRGTPSGQNPSGQGAKVSALVPGPVSRPNKMSKAHHGSDNGRWAELPPRRRQQLINALRKRMTERRGDLVREYHRTLSETSQP